MHSFPVVIIHEDSHPWLHSHHLWRQFIWKFLSFSPDFIKVYLRTPCWFFLLPFLVCSVFSLPDPQSWRQGESGREDACLPFLDQDGGTSSVCGGGWRWRTCGVMHATGDPQCLPSSYIKPSLSYGPRGSNYPAVPSPLPEGSPLSTSSFAKVPWFWPLWCLALWHYCLVSQSQLLGGWNGDRHTHLWVLLATLQF